MHNRILIGKPYVETDESSAYLKADILFPDGGQTVFFLFQKLINRLLLLNLQTVLLPRRFRGACVRDLTSYQKRR